MESARSVVAKWTVESARSAVVEWAAALVSASGWLRTQLQVLGQSVLLEGEPPPRSVQP